MINAYKDGVRKDNLVTVADGNERVGFVCPLLRGRILDLDWNESWLAVLARDDRPAETATDLVIYRMADLAEVARLESVRFASELMIIAGTDLIGVGFSGRVMAIYRLPDLSDAWQDLPGFFINTKGHLRRFALPRADDETHMSLGFPLFQRNDGSILGTIHASDSGKPNPVGLMDVDVKNRQLTPRIMEFPRSTWLPLTSSSPCGRFITRATGTFHYKGRLGQDEYRVWHRIGHEVEIFRTEDLSLYKRLELGDVAESCEIGGNEMRVGNSRRKRSWFGLGSFRPSGTVVSKLMDFVRPPSFERIHPIGVFWPGHSKALYFRSQHSLRRIPMTGPAGPWIHGAGSWSNKEQYAESQPAWDVFGGRDRDLDVYVPSTRSGTPSLSPHSVKFVREVGKKLLICHHKSMLEVSLDDPDRVMLWQDSHKVFKPKPLKLADVANNLPSLSRLKSWKPEHVESCLEELTDRLRSEFSDMVTDRFEPFFGTRNTILTEREFFTRIEKKSIEITPTVRRYVDTFLSMAEQHDHEPFDTEEPGAITPALDYLVAREDATDLILRYVRQSDRDHSYHVRDVLLRDIVSTAWENEIPEAPHYAVTEATAWVFSGSLNVGEGMRYLSPFEHLGVLEKCRTRLSPAKFAELISLVASEFGVDPKELAEDCCEGLDSSFWDRKTKQILSEY